MKRINKKSSLILVMLMLVLIPVTAQEYDVEFVDGYAEAQINGDWYDLYIGDVLDLDSQIRVHESSVVELYGNGSSLTLTKPGLYSLRDLNSQVSEREDVGLGSLVGNKLGSMFGGGMRSTSDVPTAVGGVRGDLASGSDDFGWIESEVDEIIDSGVAALERNQYQEALDYFLEAYDYSMDDEEESKSLFYIGYTYSLLGEPYEALSHLDSSPEVPADEVYAPYYLLKGQLLIETFDYTGATALLEQFDPDYASSDDEQAVYFLMGYAYKNMNNGSKASTYLTKAYNLGRDSDIGQSAYQLLNN